MYVKHLLSMLYLMQYEMGIQLQYDYDGCFSAQLLVILDLISSVSRPKLLLVLIRGWVCCRQGMLKTFPDPLAALLLICSEFLGWSRTGCTRTYSTLHVCLYIRYLGIFDEI